MNVCLGCFYHCREIQKCINIIGMIYFYRTPTYVYYFALLFAFFFYLPAPCPPTNLTAKANCGTNLGTLNWAPSVNSVSYTATMTGTHGHVASCSSNTTTCSAKLDCGHHYTATLVASTASCNSSTGPSLTFHSGKNILIYTCFNKTLFSSWTLFPFSSLSARQSGSRPGL